MKPISFSERMHPSDPRQLQLLMGWVVAGECTDGLDTDDPLDQPYTGLILRHPTTNEKRVLWFQADEEDNGPGTFGVHPFNESTANKEQKL